jgi:nucleotide-binding universal stress UspA family protein
MSAIPTILCPTDFSACSRRAFRLAAALAGAQGARVLVLHVNPTLGPIVAYGGAMAQLQPPEYRDKLWHALRHFQAADSRVRVEHRVAEGDPVHEILRVVDETACELIVMGTHGRGGLGRLLLGSVAAEVMRQAPCPVVTVKVPPQEPTPPGDDPARAKAVSC